MPLGLLTGLGAALAWGTLDIISAIAARRIGSLMVTTGIQLVGAVFILSLAAATATMPSTDPRVIAWGMAVGLAGAGAYLAYFTGLRIGPIAVVSGVVAAYGGLTVVLAVVIRGETLTPLQAIGATLATIGVVLTGLHFDGGWRRTRFASPGVVFAIVALVLFASMSIASDIAIDYAGWLEVLVIARSTNAVLSILILVAALTVARRIARPVLIGEDGQIGGLDARMVGLVALAGLLDVLGLVVYMYGLEHAETWLVGLASSFGPAVTILFAVAAMGERLRGIQWVGIAALLAGMVAIGLP
ncbi:MAG TPA: DMT family transporter [Candidatus Limnocylindrales bacterium]